MDQPEVRYSLGYNFDPALISGVIEANEQFGGSSKIDEFFGALPDSPISSARPTSRIPTLSWGQFTRQIRVLRDSQIAFNFLMNTAERLDSVLRSNLESYLRRLADIGIERLTVGTPELCAFVKDCFPHFHVTISITYGVNSREKLLEAEASGANAVYLDGVIVNRDFDLLRTLLDRAKIECRLYANISCLSRCPAVRQHYAMFSGVQSSLTSIRNDAFFAGCSLVKIRNPTEWLQMPWIRPEDVSAYAAEGIRHFKLADRLAPTATLLAIARSYLKKSSPDNLFELMERDGSKYKLLIHERSIVADQKSFPLFVYSKRIPADFIDHFRGDGCKSNDLNCKVCVTLAQKSVMICRSGSEQLPRAIQTLIPLDLRKRARLND